MNKKRLLKLSDLLIADAKNKKGVQFDLGLWGQVSALPQGEKPRIIKVDCGTQACAIGLACITNAFKRSGFTYDVTSKDNGSGNNIRPLFGKYRNFDAVEKFFEINRSEAEFLFLDNKYNVSRGAESERKVAKRIRDFVAGKVSPSAEYVY